jgi:hypothetical protein
MHLLRIVLLSAAMTGGLAQADALDGLFDSLARHCEASPALVAAPGHPLAGRAALHLAELAPYPFVSAVHRERGGLARCVADLPLFSSR